MASVNKTYVTVVGVGLLLFPFGPMVLFFILWGLLLGIG